MRNLFLGIGSSEKKKGRRFKWLITAVLSFLSTMKQHIFQPSECLKKQAKPPLFTRQARVNPL